MPRSRCHGVSIFLALVAVFWALAACLLPVFQDEAYYAMWAEHLDFGYFDHPPWVAVQALSSRLWPGSFGGLRLGTLITAILAMGVAQSLFCTFGLTTVRARLTASSLLFGSLVGLAFGVLTTPDTGLMLAWAWALREGGEALAGRERRWLLAGLATGLGLWAKYTMVLIGPVFLWALIDATWRGSGRGLKSPWVYAGGILALVVWLPHLAWNAQNDWITLRFQMRHGLSLERPSEEGASHLPRPVKAVPDSAEWRLSAPFVALDPPSKKPPKIPHFYDPLLDPLMPVLEAVERTVGYYGSQMAMWGGCLVALVLAWRRSPGASFPRAAGESLRPGLRTLAKAAAVVPLIVCGLLSLGGKVEANWSAMYLFGASLSLTPLVLPVRRALLSGVGFNMIVVALFVLHARTGWLPLHPRRDRIMAETHGYEDLARHVAARAGPSPLFVETYQLASMLRFYEPDIKLTQWPGVTRDSEWTRNRLLSHSHGALLGEGGDFWLLTGALPPPQLRPYRALSIFHYRDCRDAGLQLISAPVLFGSDVTVPCRSPIHLWYLIRYGS